MPKRAGKHPQGVRPPAPGCYTTTSSRKCSFIHKSELTRKSRTYRSAKKPVKPNEVKEVSFHMTITRQFCVPRRLRRDRSTGYRTRALSKVTFMDARLLWRDAGPDVLRNQEKAWLDRLDRDGSADRRSNKHTRRSICVCLPELSLPPSSKPFGLVSESVLRSLSALPDCRSV